METGCWRIKSDNNKWWLCLWLDEVHNEEERELAASLSLLLQTRKWPQSFGFQILLSLGWGYVNLNLHLIPTSLDRRPTLCSELKSIQSESSGAKKAERLQIPWGSLSFPNNKSRATIITSEQSFSANNIPPPTSKLSPKQVLSCRPRRRRPAAD